MTLKTDNEMSEKLITEYMIKKFLPSLERELLFAKFAPPRASLPRLTWSQKVRRGCAAYTSNLWSAILGRTPDNDQYDDGEY